MSRKRFIKLMMARGYSRNTATALATQVSWCGSYTAMYQCLGVYNVLAVMCDALAAVFSGFAENFRRAANG